MEETETSEKNMKVAVFVLRGQPFHNAHLKVVQYATQFYDKVIIAIGSYRTSITIKNPWNFEIRKQMILGCLTKTEQQKVVIEGIRDYLYSIHTWTTSLQSIVTNLTSPKDEITLVGCYKDDSSFYLNCFPQWKQKKLRQMKEDDKSIDATAIRQMMYEENPEWKKYVPVYVASMIEWYMSTDDFLKMQNEYRYNKAYKESWKDSPYPPTFVTTDAVVVYAGHVLLVVRKSEPGKGYFALPGGFLNQNETIRQCTIRELKEETKIDLDSAVIDRCIKETHTFDHPLRSLRGRTITHASLVELDYNKPMPSVKGADDAERALWMPFNELALHEEMFFEDHIHIIGYFLSGKLYNR